MKIRRKISTKVRKNYFSVNVENLYRKYSSSLLFQLKLIFSDEFKSVRNPKRKEKLT